MLGHKCNEVSIIWIVLIISVFALIGCADESPEEEATSLSNAERSQSVTPTVSPQVLDPPTATPEASVTRFVPNPTPEYRWWDVWQPIISPSRIVDIAASGTHTLALREDGKVWGWGLSEQLGFDGDTQFVPAELPIESVKYIYAGYASLFITESGQLFQAGLDNRSQGITALDITDVTKAWVFGDTVYALRDDGTLWAYISPSSPYPLLVTLPDYDVRGRFIQLPFDGIIDLQDLGAFALFVYEDGSLRVWGQPDGLLGLGTQIYDPPQLYGNRPNVIDVQVARRIVTLRSDGSVIEHWGEDEFNLFEGAVQISGHSGIGYGILIDEQGQVWGWGTTGEGNLAIHPESAVLNVDFPVRINMPYPIVSIAAGRNAYVLDNTGTVWGWGANRGAFGTGPVEELRYELIPVPILQSP